MEPDRAPVPQARINEMIRAPKVRLVDENGEQVGIKDTNEAREYAWDKNLDLVEVAAQADPPVHGGPRAKRGAGTRAGRGAQLRRGTHRVPC